MLRFELRIYLRGCQPEIAATDHESIGGYESFRGDLRLLYLPRLHAATGELVELTLVPLQTWRLALKRPTTAPATRPGQANDSTIGR